MGRFETCPRTFDATDLTWWDRLPSLSKRVCVRLWRTHLLSMAPPLCYTEGVRLKLNSLEKRLFSAAQPDQAWGALIASGVNSSVDLDNYLAKLNTLYQQVAPEIPTRGQLQKAKALFDWLWTKKPYRYQYQGSFRLTHVVDAQLDPRIESVGNCLGLTVLYNALAQRCGLEMKAVYLEEAHGRRSHVFSTFIRGNNTVDMDNIFPNGFDFKDHLHNPERVLWGNSELIADIYHSIAWALHEQGKLDSAILNYSKAIRLNPKYAKAYLNRGIALSMLGREAEAMRDLERQV
jgi:tetratricopeptide (TPR) repeat protein